MGKWEWLTDPFGMRRLAEIYREDKRVAKTDSDGIPEVIPFLIIWRKKATALRVLHVLLGFSSVVFSLLTTTVLQFGNSNNNFLAKVFALIAAVSIGLMTAFNLGRKSKDMTNAWRGLVTAVMRYNNYKNVEKKDVIDAYASRRKVNWRRSVRIRQGARLLQLLLSPQYSSYSCHPKYSSYSCHPKYSSYSCHPKYSSYSNNGKRKNKYQR